MNNDSQGIKKTAYSCYFEIQLSPEDFGKSREEHNKSCNEQLLFHLQTLSKDSISLHPEIPNDLIIKQIQKNKTKSPNQFTWEHCSSRTANNRLGVMRLVPYIQHAPGSEFQHIFHGEVNKRGGYHEWAVPAGAPVPLSKTNAHLQKYKSTEISSAPAESIRYYIEKAIRTNNFTDLRSALNRAADICSPTQVSQIFTRQIANNDSLLHIAAANGHIPTIHRILSLVTHPEEAVAATNYAQNTVTHIAAHNNRLNVIKILTRYGADLTVKNKNNQSGYEILESASSLSGIQLTQVFSQSEHEAIHEDKKPHVSSSSTKPQAKQRPPSPPPLQKKSDSSFLKSAPPPVPNTPANHTQHSQGSGTHHPSSSYQKAPLQAPESKTFSKFKVEQPVNTDTGKQNTLKPHTFDDFVNQFTHTNQSIRDINPPEQDEKPRTFHELVNRYTTCTDQSIKKPDAPVNPKLITIHHLMKPSNNVTADILNSIAYREQFHSKTPQLTPRPQFVPQASIAKNAKISEINLWAQNQKKQEEINHRQQQAVMAPSSVPKPQYESHSNSIFCPSHIDQPTPQSNNTTQQQSQTYKSSQMSQAHTEHQDHNTHPTHPHINATHTYRPSHQTQQHQNMHNIDSKKHQLPSQTIHNQQKQSNSSQNNQSNTQRSTQNPLPVRPANQMRSQQGQQQAQQRAQQQAQQRAQQQAQQRAQQQAQQRAQQQAQQRAQQQAQQRAQQQAQQRAAQEAATQRAAQQAAAQRAAQQAAAQKAAQQAATQRAAQQAAAQRAAQQAAAQRAQQTMAARGGRR
jgi:hypothetical protein